MKKSDLKSGMLVEDREGRIGLVMLNTANGDVIVSDGEYNTTRKWGPLGNYNDDLTRVGEGRTGEDILKIYSGGYNKITARLDKSHRMSIWKREEIKEMTIEEIEEELGYKIKIK